MTHLVSWPQVQSHRVSPDFSSRGYFMKSLARGGCSINRTPLSHIWHLSLFYLVLPFSAPNNSVMVAISWERFCIWTAEIGGKPKPLFCVPGRLRVTLFSKRRRKITCCTCNASPFRQVLPVTRDSPRYGQTMQLHWHNYFISEL